MNKKIKKKVVSTVISLGILVVVILLDELNVIDIEEYLNEATTTYQTDDITSDKNTLNNTTLCDVVRVVDGDTLVIKYNNKDEKVRLIGIDTPESVHPNQDKNTEFGEQVSNYSKQMLTNKQVELEFDVEKRDKYGRLLAYVYVDGYMYNKLLLEKGYAKLATYPPNVKYVDEFTQIQKYARANKEGLWAY